MLAQILTDDMGLRENEIPEILQPSYPMLSPRIDPRIPDPD